MEYLGSLGRLVALSCPSEERVQPAPRYTEEFTVEGRRRVQVRPASPRVWDLSVGVATPAELAALSGFVTGAWGPGPWHWVPVQAQLGNLLTPREAQLVERASVSSTSIQDAGPVRDADGLWSPRSVTVSIDSGWVALARDVPVVPGLPFTFSCDVQGGFTAGQVHVQFYDAAGGSVGLVTGTAPNAGMRRVSATSVVPSGAVSAIVGVRSQTLVATRPQATWTPGPVPWSAGHGCRSAVVDGWSEDLLATNSYGTYSNASFSIMEVS